MKTGRNTMLRFAAALLMLLTAFGCRRPLYVAGDEFYSAILHTDWRAYQKTDPDGMTAWFFPEDDSEKSYRYTTADVRELRFNIPSGRYTGVVIDYSPQEYSRQEFIEMDYASTALVQATVAGEQPDSLVGLYGPLCWREPVGPVNPVTGLYEVTNSPEPMALDTLRHMDVLSGKYGFYIPYEERDTYESTISVQDFYAYPVTPIWQLRIRIFVRGINYLYDLEGSVAGLANGRYLALNRPTDVPCLLRVTGWDILQTGDNEGYVSVEVSTFGLLHRQRPLKSVLTKTYETSGLAPLKPSAVIADWTDTEPLRPDDVRLNLRFLLRNRATILYYHFDVGEYIVSYDDDLVLRLDLGRDFPGGPDLPFVDPYNSAGFDADVTPWVDGGNADVTM